MKNLFITFLVLSFSFAHAQNHLLHKHNGENLNINYIRNQNNIVYYTLPSSSVENQISMYAIDKIVDKSDNKLLVYSNKISVSSESDYKKVIVLTPNQAKGLTIIETIVKPIRILKGYSPMSLVELTKNRIKKEAASKGFPFVTFSEVQYGKIQAIAYKY